MDIDAVASLRRIGAYGAVVGSILAAIGNLIHPVTPRNDPPGVAAVIAESDHWTLIHVIIVAGIFLMLGGLLAICATLHSPWSRLGAHAATIGTTIGAVTVMLDGVAAKYLADQWAAAPEESKATALALVSTNETLNFALAGLFNLSFAGIPFILIGLAVARSDAYPHWLGWIAVAAGAGSIAAGLVQAFTGEPTIASLILTIIGPTIVSLWVLVMGVLLWRGPRQPALASTGDPSG